jgi:DcuC family C4-dicarboxylate transporter
MDWFPGAIALLTLGAAVVLVARGWDVRLVLLAAALVIAGGAELAGAAGADRGTGAVSAVVREFLATFSNEKFVVPICTAMGFAYVLKHTGCERHLVLLLVAPLRRVRGLLVPGVVVVGFLVNVPLVSQTSTAVCLGAVVVPLMRAAGYAPATIGACLLLGASVGGELLNPGAPELLTVFKETGVSTTEQATVYLPPLVFVQLAVTTVVLWVLSAWWERKGESRAPTLADGLTAPGPFVVLPEPAPPRINPLKALVPLVPLGLLFATNLPEGYKLFDVPDRWVMALRADGTRDPAYNTRLIGLAMLVGVAVAAAVTPTRARECVKEFFAGAGYGFTNVVSLIVTATCFGKAIEGAGVARTLGELIRYVPELMQPLACFVPLAFAALCGSGMASTQSLYTFFHGPAVRLGLDPVAVGALVSLGSAAGRTMSPVAAVVLMCGTLTGTNPFALARRVAVPLLVGAAVVVALRLAGAV